MLRPSPLFSFSARRAYAIPQLRCNHSQKCPPHHCFPLNSRWYFYELPSCAPLAVSRKCLFSTYATCGTSEEPPLYEASCSDTKQTEPRAENDPCIDRINSLIKSRRVVLFMKGTAEAPECRFSKHAVDLLRQAGCDSFTFVNVLRSEKTKNMVKLYSGWPTYPQLFIDGELVGGCDVMSELSASGELQTLLCDKTTLPGSADIGQVSGDNAESYNH